jgi:hypothetical protein
MVEDVTGWPEWYSETQLRATGTSSQTPPPKKDKHQVPRSPHKQPIVALILLCITDGI